VEVVFFQYNFFLQSSQQLIFIPQGGSKMKIAVGTGLPAKRYVNVNARHSNKSRKACLRMSNANKFLSSSLSFRPWKAVSFLYPPIRWQN
jgi:hypothetical protein